MKTLAMLTCASLLTLSCSSDPYDKESSKKEASEDAAADKAAKPGKKWDYNKIREARANEQADSPADVPVAEDAECTVMTREQMIRSKGRGCKPVDDRAGYGEGKFCCPSNPPK